MTGIPGAGTRVSEPARYQRSEQLRRAGDVVTSRGVDALTGLAVLIYDFPGQPRIKPGRLDSEGVPAILAAGFDGSRGVLVTAYPQGAAPLAATTHKVDDDLALQLLRVLRDAARVGLVHGDLTNERLLTAHAKLYIEGYGAPWGQDPLVQPTSESVRAALAKDLAGAVGALLALAGNGLSEEVSAALRGAVQGASRGSGDAVKLYSVVRRLAGGAVTVPPAGFGDLVLPTVGKKTQRPSATALDDLDLGPPPSRPAPPAATPQAPPDSDPLELDEAPASASHAAQQAQEPTAVFEPGPPAASSPRDGAPSFPDDPDPITLNSDPGTMLTLDPRLKDSGAGFVKELPPGATYRAGNTEEDVRIPPIQLNVSAVPPQRKRAWRVPLLLVSLLLLAGVASYLALVARRNTAQQARGATAISHIVNVRVEPPNLPPVSLVVDQSPADSAYRAGTIIASVPRSVRFDAAGTWVVHATFQDRESARISLRVPDDSMITIEFPPE